MSRCFPYPPPGYVCNRATGDNALIESIKIVKEKERIKQEKKEQKRRDKELKKKEKKEKKERLKSSVQNRDGASKRKRDCDGIDDSVKRSSSFKSKEAYLQYKSEPEVEQLEQSSLTEEHGQPIVSESLCYSSDGTQSKTKKSKIEQSPSHGSVTTEGKVIRFRLKRREQGNALPSADLPSTSGRTDGPVTKANEALQDKDIVYAIPRSNEPLAFLPASVKEDSGILLTCSSQANKVSRPKSAYESLFCEWVPPPIHFDAMEVNDDDENWLLPSKKRAAQDVAGLRGYDGLSSGQPRASLQPHAQLLPEVDLYVLPFTVPF